LTEEIFFNLEKVKMQKRNLQKQKGFTLIEMLVSIALFAVVVTITFGTIVTVIDTNRKSQTLTLVMNNLNFSLESMTRTIKTSTDIVEEGSGEDKIYYFKDQDGDYVAYKEEDGQIKKCVSESDSCSSGSFSPITASEVAIENFELTLLDSGPNGQPRMFMVVNGKAQITSRVSSDFSIQTTVSVRQLQI
jgi:prepilin-type N-terminal cleavage/methylation domain-containing protein